MCMHLNFSHLNDALGRLPIWAVQEARVGIRKRFNSQPPYFILDPTMFLLVLNLGPG